MKVSDILKRYQEDYRIIDFCEKVNSNPNGDYKITGMAGSQPAFLSASIYRHIKRNMLFILNDREEALYFLNDLQTLMPKKDIVFFPASYKRPYEIEEIDNANVLQRAEVLNHLNHIQTGRQMIITFSEALSEKVINKRSLVQNTLEVKKGEACGMDFIMEVLEEYGFEREDYVYSPGQFAIRGGLLDVYSFSNDRPFRLEFFGDEVESIRVFDPVSQLSEGDLSYVSLIPNIQKILIHEERVDFLSYISPKTLIFAQSRDFLVEDLNKQFEKATKYHNELFDKTDGAALSVEPEVLYTSGDEFVSLTKSFGFVEFGSRMSSSKTEFNLEWKGNGQPKFHKEFNLLADHLKSNKESGLENFIFCENDKQVNRLQEIFDSILEEEVFTGCLAGIHRGFSDPQLKLVAYTDHEIFDRYHRYKNRSKVARSQALTLKELNELQPGDFVTHITHGIGRFAGLVKLKMGNYLKEAVKILFKDGDEVYVNVNALHKVSKYSGKDGNAPNLSKVGSKEWGKKKSKARVRIKKLAFNLVNVYAQRKVKKGFQFSPDTYLQKELEASFMFLDTPDQEKTTEEVKMDMESVTPMDRLVCGDVGFGKTEIAIRAAFKAATDGKQVAILVPTTILAVQHYNTFKERLEDFPVTVDYINRFKSTKEQNATLKALEEGKIDIIIGTHGLVNKGNRFKDLGLLVVDEEQKFGVNIKEKIKAMKVDIDTMTLTATPIPRTLQFSLLGVRDLSVINTPPANRQPVETRICGFDSTLIRDAISYELQRGGQVFFVHNRIADLEEIGSTIKKLVPDARIAIMHGQLGGDQIEKIMRGFVESTYDVLLATTIVESGIDIPNSNTIIINQAQMYGLSDLHQMRGRVGRSNRKAFCYLIAPPEAALSRDARKRLKALEEFSDLGSGFHIAMRDLDIRGAGDLLGGEQSGFISEIGYDIFHKILDDAIMELKEEHYPELFEKEIQARRAIIVSDTQIDTDKTILIPDEYIPQVSERLRFYNKISILSTEDDLRTISKELIDRFGPMPTPVLALLDTIRIREVGKQLGLERIVLKTGNLKLFFVSDPESKFYSSEMFTRLLQYVQDRPGNIRFSQTTKNLALTIKGIPDVKSILFKLLEIKHNVTSLPITNDE